MILTKPTLRPSVAAIGIGAAVAVLLPLKLLIWPELAWFWALLPLELLAADYVIEWFVLPRTTPVNATDMNATRLTTQNVEQTFFDCLPNDADTTDLVEVSGVLIKATFRRTSPEANRQRIEAFLEQLPRQFRRNIGGGWSFVNLLNDVHNRQWADEQRTMDKLVCLGLAIGKVKITSKELSRHLPGNVPFVTVEV